MNGYEISALILSITASIIGISIAVRDYVIYYREMKESLGLSNRMEVQVNKIVSQKMMEWNK